jgi:hypothetical protein
MGGIDDEECGRGAQKIKMTINLTSRFFVS